MSSFGLSLIRGFIIVGFLFSDLQQKAKSFPAASKEPLPAKPSVYVLVTLPKPSNTTFHSVYVSEVLTPSCFYVQLIGKETTQVLECLQEDLTTFYKSKEGKDYSIQDAYPGQV